VASRPAACRGVEAKPTVVKQPHVRAFAPDVDRNPSSGVIVTTNGDRSG